LADRVGRLEYAAASRLQAVGRPGRAARIRSGQAGGTAGRPAGSHHRSGRQLKCRPGSWKSYQGRKGSFTTP
jgi:hypothetical protein